MSGSLLPGAPPPAEPPVTPPVEGTPPSGEPPVAPEPPVDGAPPATPPANEPGTPPEITDEMRQAVLDQLREGVPDAPTGYELPDLELPDGTSDADRQAAIEELQSDPIIATMRELAHEAGVKPDAFKAAVKKHLDAQKAQINAARTEELGKLGGSEQEVQTRTRNLSSAIQRALPADQAQVLIGLATSADAVKALEALINKTPAGRGETPPAPKDDWATIESLMNSDAYMGLEHQRDPRVVARVDAYFAGGGKRGK